VDELPPSLFDEAPWGAWRGVPSLGTLEDAFRRSPDVGISHYGGPVAERGTRHGGAGMPVTWMDE
jgi:hypothetical protein